MNNQVCTWSWPITYYLKSNQHNYIFDCMLFRIQGGNGGIGFRVRALNICILICINIENVSWIAKATGSVPSTYLWDPENVVFCHQLWPLSHHQGIRAQSLMHIGMHSQYPLYEQGGRREGWTNCNRTQQSDVPSMAVK